MKKINWHIYKELFKKELLKKEKEMVKKLKEKENK